MRALSNEKVAIADGLCNLLEKYSKKLSKEILHFKYELEADNPGITEQIEKSMQLFKLSVIFINFSYFEYIFNCRILWCRTCCLTSAKRTQVSIFLTVLFLKNIVEIRNPR